MDGILHISLAYIANKELYRSEIKLWLLSHIDACGNIKAYIAWYSTELCLLLFISVSCSYNPIATMSLLQNLIAIPHLAEQM